MNQDVQTGAKQEVSPTPSETLEQDVKSKEQSSSDSLAEAVTKQLDIDTDEEVVGTENEDSSADQKPETESTEEEDDSKPFHQHPAWQRIIKERDEARNELTTMKPLAETAKVIANFQAQHGVTDQQLAEALELVALINTDPSKARDKLTRVVEALGGFVGDRYDEDIAADLEAGRITQERAKELMQLRAERKTSAILGEHRRAFNEQQQWQSILTQLSAWADSKSKLDPAFTPSKDGKPGVFEAVKDILLGSFAARRPTDAADAIARAEEAYNRVVGLVGRSQQRSNKPIIASTSLSSATVKTEPKSLADVLQRVAERYR